MNAHAPQPPEKTISVPVARAEDHRRFRPGHLDVVRIAGATDDHIEVALQTLSMRTVSHSMTLMADSTLVDRGRDVRFEMCEHATIELTRTQARQLAQELLRALGAEAAPPEPGPSGGGMASLPLTAAGGFTAGLTGAVSVPGALAALSVPGPLAPTLTIAEPLAGPPGQAPDGLAALPGMPDAASDLPLAASPTPSGRAGAMPSGAAEAEVRASALASAGGVPEAARLPPGMDPAPSSVPAAEALPEGVEVPAERIAPAPGSEARGGAGRRQGAHAPRGPITYGPRRFGRAPDAAAGTPPDPAEPEWPAAAQPTMAPALDLGTDAVRRPFGRRAGLLAMIAAPVIGVPLASAWILGMWLVARDGEGPRPAGAERGSHGSMLAAEPTGDSPGVAAATDNLAALSGAGSVGGSERTNLAPESGALRTASASLALVGQETVPALSVDAASHPLPPSASMQLAGQPFAERAPPNPPGTEQPAAPTPVQAAAPGTEPATGTPAVADAASVAPRQPDLGAGALAAILESSGGAAAGSGMVVPEAPHSAPAALDTSRPAPVLPPETRGATLASDLGRPGAVVAARRAVVVDTDTELPASTAAPAPMDQPSAAAPQLVVRARADTWLKVRDARGETLIARVLRAGETWTPPAVAGLRLTTGNAGGTEVVVNGTALPPLGPNGVVRRDLLLDTLRS